MHSRLKKIVNSLATETRVRFEKDNEVTLQIHSDSFAEEIQYIRIDDTGTGIDVVPIGADVSGITEATPDEAVDWVVSEYLK